MIRYNGYYVSKGKIDEDWHAGIHMKYKIFIAFLFCEDGGVLIASTKMKIACTNYYFKKIEFKRYRSLSFYKIIDNELNIYREDKSFYQKLIIENNNALIDEYGSKYSYIHWENEEKR